MADHRVPGHAEAGEKFAHLLDIDLGPPAGKIAWMHRHVGIPVSFAQRRRARRQHYSTTEKYKMLHAAFECLAQEQRIHDRVVGHVDIRPFDNVLREPDVVAAA